MDFGIVPIRTGPEGQHLHQEWVSRGATAYDSPGRKSWVSGRKWNRVPEDGRKPREFKIKRIGSINSRPCKKRKDGPPRVVVRGGNQNQRLS
jgi:hypothetical protein